MKKGAVKRPNFQEDVNQKYIDIKVILFFYTMIGLAPFKCVRSIHVGTITDKPTCQIPGSMKFVHIPFGFMYNVFLIVADVFISIMSVRRLSDNKFTLNTNYTLSVDLFTSVSHITLLNAVWLFTSVRRYHVVRLLNRLVKVDSTIRRLCNSRWIGLNRLYLIGVFAALTTIWIALVILDGQVYDSMIIDWFSDIVPSFVLIHFMLQYVLIIKCIDMGYRNLNRAIINLSMSSTVKTFRSFTVHREIALMDSDYFPNIIDFRRAHNTLYQIGSDVADFYSLPILFIISLSCFAIIYNAYNGLMPFTRKLEIDPTFFVAVSVAWVLVLMIPIAILAKSVESITNEMKKTTDAIYMMLDGSNLSRADITELERFSMELLHRKIHFSAYGLFSLDCSLVHSILSSTITYLVILFQFQISMEED